MLVKCNKMVQLILKCIIVLEWLLFFIHWRKTRFENVLDTICWIWINLFSLIYALMGLYHCVHISHLLLLLLLVSNCNYRYTIAKKTAHSMRKSALLALNIFECMRVFCVSFSILALFHPVCARVSVYLLRFICTKTLKHISLSLVNREKIRMPSLPFRMMEQIEHSIATQLIAKITRTRLTLIRFFGCWIYILREKGFFRFRAMVPWTQWWSS